MAIKDYSDEEIIEKLSSLSQSEFRHKDAETPYFEELFRRYYSQAYSLTRYYGLSHEDARDVIQDCFIRLYHLSKTFQKGKLFKPWFFKIILNQVRDRFTDLKKRKYANIEDFSEDPVLSKEENILEKLQNKEYIRGILNDIKEKSREILILKFYSGMDMESIADTLGIQQRQAYNRLEQAYTELREKIEAEYE